jgi:hypothetical protein
LQVGGLKSVAAEHEEAEGGASEEFFFFQRSKVGAERGHEERCESEPSS